MRNHLDMNRLSNPLAGADRQPSSFGASYLDQEALQQLVELMDGDKELIVDLIDTLVEETPPMLNKLKHALAGQDQGEVQRQAHSLKSSSAQMGASAFADMCKELEHQARAGQLPNEPDLGRALDDEFQRVQAALMDWKASL